MSGWFWDSPAEAGAASQTPSSAAAPANAELSQFLANDPRSECSTLEGEKQELCRKARKLLFNVCADLEEDPDDHRTHMSGKYALTSFVIMRGGKATVVRDVQTATMSDVIALIPDD